jgi:large subunit ribosomal protein L9
MQIILRKDVEGLGDRGDRVTVKPGYGRNYLIPRGFAYLATEEAAARIEAEARRAELDEAAARTRLEGLARSMEAVEINFHVKADESGHLFGSVTSTMIAEELTRTLGVTVSAKSVELLHPIKEIGPHDVVVHVFGDTRVSTKVWVLEERP